MNNLSKALLIFGFVGLFSFVTLAQAKPPFSRLKSSAGHISSAGRFSIMLPINPDSERRITAAEGISGGMQYFWRTKDGEFFVTYFDNLTLPEDPKEDLEAGADAYLSGIIKNGGKLLEKKNLILGKNLGIEIKASLKSNEIVIIRYYSVEKRVYVLSTRLNANETGAKQIKTLDTFKLLGNKKIS